MNKKPMIQERYKKGKDIINYVVYRSKTGNGNDEVLQHKLMGMMETAHVTLHPDGTVNFRVKLNKRCLEAAVKGNLIGFAPDPSFRVRQFLSKIRNKI